MSLKHEVDKVIVYERAGLLFIFNFHATQSFTDYRVGVEEPGVYRIVLSSDEKEYGGFGNISPEGKYFTTPMGWNGRKNWLQVCRLFFFSRVYSRSWIGVYPVQDMYRPCEVMCFPRHWEPLKYLVYYIHLRSIVLVPRVFCIEPDNQNGMFTRKSG